TKSFGYVRGRAWSLIGRLLFLLGVQLFLVLIVPSLVGFQGDSSWFPALTSFIFSMFGKLFSVFYLVVVYRQFSRSATKGRPSVLQKSKLYLIVSLVALVGLVWSTVWLGRYLVDELSQVDWQKLLVEESPIVQELTSEGINQRRAVGADKIRTALESICQNEQNLPDSLSELEMVLEPGVSWDDYQYRKEAGRAIITYQLEIPDLPDGSREFSVSCGPTF
ncbi:hypothetical protein MUP65_00855, partial [Patescibacteria group bacterium]|nr:hypothetical protein [Patescibacteria group bacterium]